VERAIASDNRIASDTERILSARERAEYLVDELTGAHRRAAGLFELERELIRAQRTDQAFTLAFVDVDGLKAVNDGHGHSAGDDLLVLVADTIRDHLRPYDLLVRYGGDEFLCGLLGMDVGEVARRFELINVQLGVSSRASVSAGFSELTEDGSLTSLIRRADDDLYGRRKHGAAMEMTAFETAESDTDDDQDTADVDSGALVIDGVGTLLRELLGAPSGAQIPIQGAIRNSPSYDWLSQFSMVDLATGFVHRRLLLDRVSQAMLRAKRSGSHVMLFYVGIRNFGLICDTFGHAVGDAMLRELSLRLSSGLRNEDTLGRVGESELVVLFTIEQLEVVHLLEMRLQLSLTEPIRTNETDFHLSSSVGMAIAKDGEAANDLLRRAHRAMSLINHRRGSA
jgi:diguanylate cyclase (GGDEF)-like protein